VGFGLEAVIIVIVLLGSRKLLRDVPYTGDRGIDLIGAGLSVLGMGGLVLGILAWQEGGESVGILMFVGLVALAGLVFWLLRQRRRDRPALLDPHLFAAKTFSFGVSEGILQQVALGGLLIALPIYLQMVLEYNAMEAGLTLAPLSLTMFAVALLAARRAGKRRPSVLILAGFVLLLISMVALIPLIPGADTGWPLVPPLILAGCGLGLLVSQLNNYTLAPVSEERVGEASGVNSATGSFGLSLGLALAGAVMLAALSIGFTDQADSSTVLDPAAKDRVATVLEDDAQVISNTQLEELLVGQPEDVREEIIAINTDVRPKSLQIALLVPLIAALAGLGIGLRMVRLPDQ
jgi:LPXTG-motif cell wall-anchored protein